MHYSFYLIFINTNIMRSIKFTEAELEFLQGQYQLELIEAEKYIVEIKNILKKLGRTAANVAETSAPPKKKGRGRPPREANTEQIKTLSEKPAAAVKKKKGKRGRPKKRGRKKGSKRISPKIMKAVNEKTAGVSNPALKPLEIKAVTKAKPVLKKAKKLMPPKTKSC